MMKSLTHTRNMSAIGAIRNVLDILEDFRYPTFGETANAINKLISPFMDSEVTEFLTENVRACVVNIGLWMQQDLGSDVYFLVENIKDTLEDACVQLEDLVIVDVR